MDEELKSLLKENLEISRENLKILKKMNRARIFGSVFWVIKWVVIIGLSYGAYVYIEPYFRSFLGIVGSLTSEVNEIKKITDTPMDFLKKIPSFGN